MLLKIEPNKKSYINWGKVLEYLNQNILYVVLLAIIIMLSIGTDKFFTISNIITILRKVSISAIIAVGMTIVILIGQVDLSVGAVVAFSSVATAFLMDNGFNAILAILISIVIGSLWGLINGFIVVRYNIHSFLVTMVMTIIIRAVIYLICQGYSIQIWHEGFYKIGNGFLLSIPFPVIYMVIAYVAGSFVLNRLPYGRFIFAIGGNSKAAIMSGIRIDKIKLSVFVVSAFLSSIGGVILSSRIMAGSSAVGQGWELDIIAAVLIGGTRLDSGEGKLSGTLLGAIFLGIIANGMNLIGVPAIFQDIVKGILILSAIILNNRSNKK